jgi:hypothetical protein
MAPVETLDRQIKELQAPIEAASAAIDAQVKAFEDREKAGKRAELEKHFVDYAPILAEVVPFGRIERDEWRNKTYGLMKAFEDIESIVDRIARDDATLDSLGLTHLTDAKTTYFETLDLSAAIARSKALDEADERTRRLEAEKAEIAAYQAEQAAKVVVPEPVSEPTTPTEVAFAATVAADLASTWTFTVTCTASQRESIVGSIRALGLTGTVRKVQS